MPFQVRVARSIALVAIFALSSVAAPGILISQAGAAGSLAGEIADPGGEPLAGATIVLSGTPFRTFSDRTGQFRITGVDPGSYSMVVSYIGYAPDTVAVAISPGETERREVVLETAPIELGGVVVEGQRLGQAQAINQQKAADHVVSIVAAEQIQRLPDPNTAEALQRLPGVSIQRDQGEGRYVLIRGTAPRLNAITINGNRVPSPEGDVRSVALDVIPSDLLSAVEVSKTLTPDMDADAIGGSINLVTRTPSAGRPLFQATAAGGYNDLMSDGITQFAGSYGGRFGADNRAGFLLGASYYNTNRGSDNLEMEWATAEIDGAGQEVPGVLELRDYTVTRERLGVTGLFDYRFSPQSSVYLRGIFNAYGDQEYRRAPQISFEDGEYLPGRRVAGVELVRELKDRYEEQRIYNIAAGGEHLLGGIGVDYGISFSHAEEAEPDAQYTIFTSSGDVSYDLSNPRRPGYDFDEGAFTNLEAYGFEELAIENNYTEEDEIAGEINVSLPYGFGRTTGSLQFGGKVRLKDKMRNNEIRIYDGFDGTLTLADLAGSFEDEDFFFDRYTIGRVADPGQSRQFASQNLERFELNESDSNEASDAEDFDADENVYAGYLMTTVDVGPLQLIPGVRVEATRQEYNANELIFNEEGVYVSTTEVPGTNEYVHFLPGVNVRYRLDANTNLRAAATRSLSRPNYFDLAPYRLVFREDEEVAIGNPGLAPTLSTNLDLLAEHYFQSIGVLSGGVFYKRLSDYIYTQRFDATGGELGGNLDGFRVQQPQNGESASLIGVELAWQQQLTFLPGVLNGFGILANYTLTDSEAEFPGREGEPATLPGQARHVGNVALSYEKFGFYGTAALNFHGRYIDEVGGDASEDIYYDDHVQLDVSLSQQVTRNARLFLGLVNLTNAPLRYYEGSPDRPIQQEYYSWWGTFGVKVDL